MPHSSGGGSHGGGSHHSSSHSSSHRSSSGGGSSRIRTSRTYFPGARRFVYYRNGVPNYVYSDTDLSKGPSKLRFLMLIFYVPFVLAAFLMIFTSFGVPEKLKVDYNSQIVIQDDANVLGDTTKLGDALEDFFNTTGISPAVITVYNSDWEDNYTDLEKYAYELYVNRFYDEKHWLIVYSQPKDPDDEFNNWYWEGMQGDDTDSIITSSVAYDFTNDLHKRLLVEGTKVNDAISNSKYAVFEDEFYNNSHYKFAFETTSSDKGSWCRMGVNTYDEKGEIKVSERVQMFKLLNMSLLKITPSSAAELTDYNYSDDLNIVILYRIQVFG